MSLPGIRILAYNLGTNGHIRIKMHTPFLAVRLRRCRDAPTTGRDVLPAAELPV